MRTSVVVVGEGAERYFSHNDSSTWTLPADQLEDWLSGLKEKAKAERARVETGNVAVPGESIAARNLTKALASDIKKKANVTVNSGDWVVRVHLDGGQVFYENTVSNESTWFNPLLDFGQDANPVTQIFADNWVEWDERREEELEQVAGFDALVDRSRFEVGELKWAQTRLDKWLTRKSLEVSEHDSLGLKWAEYANVERLFNASEYCEVFVNMEDYPHLPMQTVRLGAPYVTLGTTVRELHDLLFSRTFKKTESSTLSIDDAWVKGADNSEVYERYVYKVVGCTEFLVHHSFALAHFDHVSTCAARRMRIELLLVKLSDGDALDLQDKITEGVREVKVKMHAHARGTEDDDFRRDRDEAEVVASSNKSMGGGGNGAPSQALSSLPSPYSLAVANSAAWDSNQTFPIESINWSFRVKVNGISGLNAAMPEELPFDPTLEGLSVCVQMALFSGGTFLKAGAGGNKGGGGSKSRGNGGGGGGPGNSGGMGGAGGDDGAGGKGSAVAMELVSDVKREDWDLTGHHGQALHTQSLPYANGGFDQEWPGEWATTAVKIRNLPLDTRVCFRVVVKAGSSGSSKRPVAIAGVALPIINFKRALVAGSVKCHLWPSEKLQEKRDKDIAEGEKDPQFLALESRPVGENPERNTGVLHLTFDSYELPVMAKRPTYNDYRDRLTLESSESGLPPSMPPSSEQAARLGVLEQSSPLRALCEADKQLLFSCRDYAAERPLLLPRLVEAVDWSDPRQVDEGRMAMVRAEEHVKAHKLEIVVLQLLDVRYGDPVVREFAVRQLDRLNDCQLGEVMLQLTQVLKYEPDHDSPLARMLLRRSIRNPLRLGQMFFWMLRSEMHLHCINDRYGLLLKLYLQRCGPHKTTLSRQLFINESLTSIAQAVHNVRPKKAKKYNEFVQRELRKLDLPPKFSLCHAPKVELTAIVIEKAGVMTSKKLPLRLDFVNADPHARTKYRALFKCGDDLRQDLLTLQVLGVMERLWLESGLTPRMIPYACSSAGDQLGFIEWVTESTTTAWVQTTYGGKYGALKKENMRKHIAAHNKSSGFEDATMDFMQSCASYCVATYVLGIGDRHSDNIMVKENGMLFHIDFGHFLGNFKQKMGVKRERDNFVFTPDFCYVLGGAYVNNFGTVVEGDERNLFLKFEQMCGRAYNVLRENKALLMNLFVLMIPAGMPELTQRSDVAFIDDKLMLGLPEEDAARHFSKEIKNALNTITRRIDNLAHTVKHYK